MRFYFLYIVLISFIPGVVAQTYNFSRYSEENGLNQPYIYCISQSNEGFLILSAGEAICTFDGAKFTSLSNKSIAENIVVSHFIDSRKITWFVHQQYGLSCIKDQYFYNIQDTTFRQIKFSQITEDKKNRIWLAGSNGLYSVGPDLKASQTILLKDKMVRALNIDARNNILAGTQEGLFIIKTNNDKQADIYQVPELKDKNIKQVISANSSGLSHWVLTDDGIYGLSFKNGTYKLLRYIYQELNCENFNVNYIYKDRYNNLWVSVFGEGLRKITFNANPLTGSFSVSTIDKRNGLKSQNIQSVFQDSEGNMWFGTFGDGLIKKPLELFSFYGNNDGITYPDIKKAVTDINGNLWLAANNGLAMYNKNTHDYKLYNKSNGFINDKITTLYSDATKKIWIGTAESGIYTLDPRTLKFTRFSQQHNLQQPPVNTITEANGRIMAGTTDGIYIYGQNAAWGEVLTTNDGLFHNNVQHLFSDSKKRLWISSHGAPPYFISDQKITAFKKVEGLSSFNITAVCEDADHTIWIATDADGVFRYKDTTFYHYSTEDGLLSNYCYGIETDKNNAVWVTHKNGLSQLAKASKKFTAYTNQRGLLFTENNTNAIYKDDSENLWFGTTEGIVMYNAESEKSLSYMPEVFVSGIILNTDSFGSNEPINKKYGYYSVHIDYKAVSLSDPGAIYYRYRLTNIDSNWKTTIMPYIDFPKLGDGEYTFEVMACNSTRGLCSAIISTSFTIQKPVWKHWWFYLLLFFVIVMTSVGITALRTRALKKTQALLELKIEEKTYLLKREKEAVELIKTDLENKNKDITASIHYAKNIQDSLLPPTELMKELFGKNHFVLYKPKDIVSGDFYWCSGVETAHGSKLSLAGVIDCTGHGVPGAFLSILANDFLKQSLSEETVKMPDEILNYLNKSISSHLNQHPSKSRIRDGMDVALVGIDYSAKKLYYSGANNPIYIFRNGANGVEEIIVKATKQPIGSANEIILNYELKTFGLLEGDTIYLFSDGYADQFGGTRDKKITYKAFRAILAQAFLLPVSDQKAFIDDKFEKWKHTTEQTDDVCIMGIKI